MCKTRILVPVSNFNAQTRTLLRVNQSTVNNQARTTGATELSQVNRSVAALPTTCYLHLPPWAMLPVHLPSPHRCLLPRSLPLFSPSNCFQFPTPSLSYHVPSWRSHTRPPTQHGPPTVCDAPIVVLRALCYYYLGITSLPDLVRQTC